MHGSPEESRSPVRTVTLDLPAGVGSVYDVDGDRPPVEAYGPLDEDDKIKNMRPRLPADKTIDGSTVKLTFDEPLGAGAWKIVVYQSRIRRADTGDGFDLGDWNGWFLQVLDTGPARGVPDPGTIETKTEPDPAHATVCLDGEPVPEGTGELSGEVLRADVRCPGTVSLEVESLLDGARTTLYEQYKTRVLADETQEEPRNKRSFWFASVGPIQSHRWAEYQGTETLGRLPISEGQMAYGTAVVRPPEHAGVDPLLSKSAATGSPSAGHPNAYNTATFTAQPEQVGVGIEEYESPTLVAPKTINDPTNTPETNPRLYPGGVYFEDQIPAGRAAVFDLPINSTLRLKVGGAVQWWGQTRLVPTLMRPRTAAQQVPDVSASTPAGRANLQRRIWRASMEAVALWGEPLPTDNAGNGIVVSTMTDYVLTSLAMGSEYEAGTQGRVTGTQGGHRFSAQSDRTLRRRKHRLAELLEEQEASAPPMPEDHAPGVAAEIGSEAQSGTCGRSAHLISEDYAAIYDPTRQGRISYEHQKRDLRRR